MAKQHRPAPKPQRPRHFIKEWREYRGLSQEQLAERVGKTRGLIGQIETYKTSYTASIEAIADALNCTPDDLRRVNPFKEGKVIDIMDLLRQATPDQRERVLGFVQAVVQKSN